jgi:hypothetical protein
MGGFNNIPVDKLKKIIQLEIDISCICFLYNEKKHYIQNKSKDIFRNFDIQTMCCIVSYANVP